MEPLVALEEILLQAIPTFLLVWLLYLYTVQVFFRPLQKTLQKRHAATGRLREMAAENIALAERKTAEYQEALRAARAEVYRQQEQERQRALERKAELLRQARQQAEEIVHRTQQEIRGEVEDAKKGLAQESEQIALSITEAILKPGIVASSSGFLGDSEGLH